MTNIADARSLEEVARKFETFGAIECSDAVPLYAELSARIAADKDVLALAAQARPCQPAPNLLFAAVHYLLLNQIQHELSEYYPDLSTACRLPASAFPVFKDFCQVYAEEIRDLISSRIVQTNEVGRAALLLPGFQIAFRKGDYLPLYLIEIGASAGLNLLWDRWRYNYNGEHFCGDPGSPVVLRCELKGALRPDLPVELPETSYCAGIDIHPLDLNDPEAVLWLRALVWPDHKDRARTLEQAIAVARLGQLPVLHGDALDLLPDLMDRAPTDVTLCIYHTSVLHQWTNDARKRLAEVLEDRSRSREIYVVSTDGWPGHKFKVHLAIYQGGAGMITHVGNCNPHGRWLEWLVP